MNKIKKFIKELPTILKLRKQIKGLKIENKIQLEVIDDLEEQIKDISDSELMNEKMKRLESSRNYWLNIVHKLRNENKELRKKLEEAEK